MVEKAEMDPAGVALEKSLEMLREGSGKRDIIETLIKIPGVTRKIAIKSMLASQKQLHEHSNKTNEKHNPNSPRNVTESLSSQLLSKIEDSHAEEILDILGGEESGYSVEDTKVVIACCAFECSSGLQPDTKTIYSPDVRNRVINEMMNDMSVQTWRDALDRFLKAQTARTSAVNLIESVCSVVVGCISHEGKPFTKKDVEDYCTVYPDVCLNDVVFKMTSGYYMPTVRAKAEAIRKMRMNRSVYSGSQFDCPICTDSHAIEETYCFNCPDSHRACVGCALTLVTNAIRGRSLPRCFQKDCKHIIGKGEVKQIEGLYVEIHGQPDVPAESPILTRYNGKLILLSEVLEQMSLQIYAESEDDVCVCPTPDCKGLIALRRPGAIERCICEICKLTFCSLCRDIYHYGVKNCSDVNVFRVQYNQWKSEGREANLREMAERKSEAAAQLREFEKRRSAHEKDVQLAREAEENELKDEKYKEDHCFYCPNCNRIMEKLDGCDLMVCGVNYHGGDQQDGCGHRFNLKNAKKYKSKGVITRRVTPLNVSKPEFQHQKHEIMAGVLSFKCDECHNDIVGPRFECIHCPAYNVCAGCESKLISNDDDFSSAGAETKQVSDGVIHSCNHNVGMFRQHVFRIHHVS